MIGGNGNDTFNDDQGNDSFVGGSGSNLFLNVAYSGQDTFTGGSAPGHDTYVLNWVPGSGAVAEITDSRPVRAEI